MCLQLVDNPADAAVFLPRLLPGLERVSAEVSDPECRGVATTAHNTLLRVGAEGTAQAKAMQALTQVSTQPYCLLIDIAMCISVLQACKLLFKRCALLSGLLFCFW